MKKKFNLGPFYLLLIPIKRLLFFLRHSLVYFKSGFIWLLTSKEHTNFSFSIDENSLHSLKYTLSSFCEIDMESVESDLNQANSLEILNNSSIKWVEKIDIDFKNKWDYRSIIYVLINNKKVHNVLEFGVDQGRIPYIIDNLYFDNNPNSGLNYIGVEYNKRKLGLIRNNKNTENIALKIDKVENVLPKIEKQYFQDSLLISSTHEMNSEKFLFDYLEENKIFPSFIVSDETSPSSPFIKFIENNNYDYVCISFSDPKKFLNSIRVGLAKKII